LHASAVAIVTQHDGEVPPELGQLRRLPGVGDYTAAAVAAFVFHRRVPVLDTNVRRVLARLLDGQAYERPGAPTVGERQRALQVLPADGGDAAATAQALMELGATVCTARRPQCDLCPVLEQCTWHAAGRPGWQGPARRGQSYAGTDRQCRGRLLAVLRAHPGPVGLDALDQVWPEAVQRRRALAGLVTDGLVEQLQPGEYALPR
jgi:A/G-specific adenine glycosylase